MGLSQWCNTNRENSLKEISQGNLAESKPLAERFPFDRRTKKRPETLHLLGCLAPGLSGALT